MSERHRELDAKALEELMREIEKQVPQGPPRTVHHPKCPVLKTLDLLDCTCGGWRFPT